MIYEQLHRDYGECCSLKIQEFGWEKLFLKSREGSENELRSENARKVVENVEIVRREGNSNKITKSLSSGTSSPLSHVEDTVVLEATTSVVGQSD